MKKTLMCAFLALSLVGAQLSAYNLKDAFTPSKHACVLEKYGETKDNIKTIVENTKYNGFGYRNAAGEYDPWLYDNGIVIQRFKNKAGKVATFQDYIDSSNNTRDKEKLRVAIAACR